MALAAAVQIGNEGLRRELTQALFACGIAISETAPDLLVLDPAAVAGVERLPPSPPVLVAHTAPEPQAILDALRAGAREFLYPPFEENLRKALGKMAADVATSGASPRRRGRVMALVSAKGGCGATTIACHLAVELQRVTAQRVLLADLDFELGLVGFLMKTHGKYHIMDAILNAHRLDPSLWHALVSNGRPQLELLPAPPPSATPVSLQSENLWPVLQFMRSQYEWVLLDVGRGLSPTLSLALNDIDELLVTTTPDVASLFHARQILQRLLESEPSAGKPSRAGNRLRVVVNRVGQSGFASEELSRAIGHSIFAQLPSEEASLREAYCEGSLLPERSALRKAVGEMAARLAGVAEEKPAKRFRWLRS